MIINDLLQEKHISRYRLSRESGVPMTTVTDICNGKADLDKCAAGTLYKIASVLHVTVDHLLEASHAENTEHRPNFELFKSNICHMVKDKGDLDFIVDTLNTDEVRKLYDRQWYREALYTLAMLDYLSRINGLPAYTGYDDLRGKKLEKPLFSAGVEVSCRVTGDESIKETAIARAIPEFLRFNIVESEIRDVC